MLSVVDGWFVVLSLISEQISFVQKILIPKGSREIDRHQRRKIRFVVLVPDKDCLIPASVHVAAKSNIKLSPHREKQALSIHGQCQIRHLFKANFVSDGIVRRQVNGPSIRRLAQ